MENTAEKTTFLAEHHAGILSTLSERDEPWGSVVFYISDDTGNIYFFTKSKTAKLQNILRRPRVAFVVYDEKNLTCLQVAGDASEVTSESYIKDVYQKLSEKLVDIKQPLPIESMKNSGQYVLVKIAPTYVHFIDYSKKPA